MPSVTILASGRTYWSMSPGIVAESDLKGNLTSEYVFFNDQRIARRDLPSGAVSYYFSDHLGTADVITDSADNIKYDADHYPWGGELPFISNDANKYKFNGHEQDGETGLYNYGARYYTTPLSRFLTPDWGGPLSIPDPVPWADLDNPQSLNLHGYARNNPISLADPDGHDCVVQTRTSATQETATVSSGNCDNVKVGDGQSKTFVDGTVTSIKVGTNGQSIDIGYTPSDGSASVGVQTAPGAPYPDSPNTAYYFGNNAQGYRQLATASGVMNDPRTYALWFGASAVVGGALAATGVIGGDVLTTLGDLTITPRPGDVSWAQKIFSQGGKKAVQKAIRSLQKRLAEHEAKVGNLQFKSSVEREISNFTRQIKALQDLLK